MKEGNSRIDASSSGSTLGNDWWDLLYLLAAPGQSACISIIDLHIADLTSEGAHQWITPLSLRHLLPCSLMLDIMTPLYTADPE